MDIKRSIKKLFSSLFSSTAALILGVFLFMSGFGQLGRIPQKGMVLIFDSLPMILGALAYKSIKKRKAGVVGNTRLRKAYELIMVAFILVVNVILPFINDLTKQEPLAFVIFPLWAMLAYLAEFATFAQLCVQKEEK